MKTDFDVKAGINAVVDYLKKDESLKKDNYYSKGVNAAVARTTEAIWAGSLCSDLGLEGRAYDDMFSKLQDGFLPNGQRMRGRNQTGKEILFHDMTLSASKSVTLHALEDIRLFDCHTRACKKTIAATEQHYAVYLQGEDRHTVLGQGIVAAIIPHWTNRNLEPQLHSHCAIFNGTMTQDGQWRSMHMHPLSRERWMGSYYRNVLAQEVQSIGYRIYETLMANGAWGFEIDGLSREQIEAFSTRTVEIEAAKVKGMDGNVATLRTRKSKGAQPSWQELRESTRQARKELGAILQNPFTDIQTIGKDDSAEAVASAITHLCERSARFKRADVYQRVFDHIENVSLAQVDQEIAQYPELLDYGIIKDDSKRIGQLTTVEALERETRTIKRWLEGQGQATPILNRARTLQKIDSIYKDQKDTLNQGQIEAVLKILESTDQHQILHGLSGIGKDRTLKPLKMIVESEGIKIKEAGASTENLQRLLYTNHQINKGDLLVINEGWLASAKTVDILTQKANDVGARILLVGDAGQNRPIEAGTPVISLIEAGATTHNVSEFLRPRSYTHRQALLLAKKGNATDALNLLNQHGYVQQIAERSERAQAIASAYLELSPEEQAKTLIVAGTNPEKDAIAQEIRTGLKAAGTLGESRTCTQLIDKGWTPEQSKDVLNYEEGDYVSLTKEYKRSGLKQGEFYRVAGIEGERLILESVKGDRFTLDPMTCYEKTVFSSRDFDIAVGDSLRWTSTNKKKGATNGATFEITAIDGMNAKAIDADGKERRIDLSKPLTVDYTLTSTSYRAQGSDRPRVFVSATSDPTSNREPFYVSISHQVHELKIWTQDTIALARRVAESNVQANPLELIGATHVRPRQDQSHSSTAQPDRAAAHRQQYFDSADSHHLARATHQDDRRYRPGFEHDSLRQIDGTVGEGEAQIGYGGNAQGIDGRDHPEYRSIDPDSAENRRAGNTHQDLQELASLIQQHKIEQALAEPLQQLRDNLDRLQAAQQKTNESLTEIVQSAKVEVLAAAIHEWRDTRALHNELQLMELASKIQSLKESQAISQGVELHKLATLVRDFKAETAIAHALVQLENVIAPKAEPDPFIMKAVELLFTNDGKRQPDGSSLVSGTTWEFKRQGDHLVVTEQGTRAIAYEVKDGKVLKDDGAKALKARMKELRDKTVQRIKDNMLQSTTKVQPRRGRGR